ncbi:MAG: CehA/McbA family metallohydrolase [Byssovorax sp.]
MPALRRSSLPAALLVVTACSGAELPPAPPAPPPPRPTSAPIATVASVAPRPIPIPAASEGTISTVKSAGQVPLTGPRVDAEPGDWLIERGNDIAVVSAEGRVVDLGERGGRDELNYVDPAVFLSLDAAHTEPRSIAPAGDGHVLHVERRVLEKPLILHSFIYFDGPILRVESAVEAADPSAATLAITIGERVEWGNSPTWSEGFGWVAQGGTFIGDFIARESFGVSYALANPAGRMQGRHSPPDLPGFYEGARTGEERIPVPAEGLSRRRVVEVAHGTGSSGRAAMSLPSVRARGTQRIALPAGLPPIARIEAARCPTGAKPGTRYAQFSATDGAIELPAGCFALRIFALGHASTAWFAPADLGKMTLPPSGLLRFAITEKGKGPVPARVLVRGQKGTPDPDWGDDPREGAALNVVFSDKGQGERELPPGRYRVIIDRGFEYSSFQKDIEIKAGQTVDLPAEVERVVDTRGFVSADLHLHAMPSPDAPQELADRVRSLVAAGVEVGVATDHNAVTDYGPTIASMGLGGFLATVIGDEVTSREVRWGHFNTFPLPPGSPPVPFKSTTPAKIFAAARAMGTLGKDTVVQVNHPRMGDIGYFDLLHLDRDDLPHFLERAPLADMSFDAVEVFNGDHYDHIDRVEDCMRDWYALLNAGYHITATGNSDSHKLTFHEAGVPRNLVMVPNDDPARFDEKAFVDAIHRGRVVVSSGPFVQLEAGGKTLGEAVPAGKIKVRVRVDAPPWVSVDRVELVRRGQPIETWKGPFPKGAHRFEKEIEESLQKGDWIIAIARGDTPMPELHRQGALPFGFTNPIWVE